MIERSLLAPIIDLCFQSHKMAFVSGPRQCGKTTLAKMALGERRAGAYHNWDDIEFRRQWAKSPRSLIPGASRQVPLVVFDEIHKAHGWKRTLKGLYDTLETLVDVLVTGSARLNVYRKGSDSLLGRYHHFRLHPLSLREIEEPTIPSPHDFIERLFRRDLEFEPRRQDNLDALRRFGAFPEPFLARDDRRARLWRASRVERVIREDLRDLSRITELSRIEMLASLLTDRVGSLFSMTPLRETLEVSLDTVRRWLASLKELYYIFEIKPYTGSIARSIRKAGKVYLWDFSEVPGEAERFENLVACHLLKTCHYWTDTGEGSFDLCFLRNKEQEEIDFLIVKDRKPWLPVEVKLSDPSPSDSWSRFLPRLPCRQGLQLIAAPGVWRIAERADSRLLVSSAAEALFYFA